MTDLLVQILLSAVGGAGSAYLDDHFKSNPNEYLKTRQIGGVAVGPGAQVSVGLAIMLAFLPKGLLPSGTIRTGLGALASGGIVVQGANIIGDHVIPVLKGEKAPNPQLPAGAPVAGWGWGGYVGHQPTSFDWARASQAARSFGGVS